MQWSSACNNWMGSNFPKALHVHHWHHVLYVLQHDKGQSNMSNLLKSRIAFNIVQPSFSVQGPCFHFHVKPACAFTSLAIAPEESRRQFSSVLMKSPMFSCTYQIYQSTPWPLGVPTYTAMAYHPHLGSSPLHTNHVCWLGSIGLLILWTYHIPSLNSYIFLYILHYDVLWSYIHKLGMAQCCIFFGASSLWFLASPCCFGHDAQTNHIGAYKNKPN